MVFFPSTQVGGGWSGSQPGGPSAVLGFLGCGAAARRGGRRRGPLVPAHMYDEAGEGGPRAVASESDAGEARGVGRAALVPSLAPRYAVPTPGGKAGPLSTSCVRGKMAALRPYCRELKMEDAAARESGRVSHPHKGKGPFPLRPLLPVTPRCTVHCFGTSVSPQRLGSRPPSGGEGILCGGVSPTLSGWRRELGQLGTDCNSPWNLPFASLGRGLFSSLKP